MPRGRGRVASESVQRRAVVVDGDTISFVEAGPADGPVLLLIHGLFSDSGTWLDVLHPLAEQGVRAIAIDLLGHGESDKPPGSYLLDDFALLLDAFMATLEIDSATICGHSLGGAIAIHFGYYFPKRVERLILVASGGLGKEVSPVLRMLSRRGAEALTGVVMGRRTVQRVLSNPRVHRMCKVEPERLPNLRRIGRTLFDADARAALFRSLRGVVGPHGQLGSFLELEFLEADLPTLLVWAKHDVIIPVLHGQRTHEHLPGSRLLVFDGGGHEPHRRNAGDFAAAVSAFVSDGEIGILSNGTVF